MIKTYYDDFFEKYPNAPRFDEGYPIDTEADRDVVLCVRKAGYKVSCRLGDHADCRDCWNSQIESEA